MQVNSPTERCSIFSVWDSGNELAQLDRFVGVEKGEFFLSHGGFVNGYTEFGVAFDRAAANVPPADLELPQASQKRFNDKLSARVS